MWPQYFDKNFKIRWEERGFKEDNKKIRVGHKRLSEGAFESSSPAKSWKAEQVWVGFDWKLP